MNTTPTLIHATLSIDTDGVPEGFLRLVARVEAEGERGHIQKRVRFRGVATLDNFAAVRSELAGKVARWCDKHFPDGYTFF